MKVQNQIDELLTLRASEWFEILKHPSDAERADFIKWLSESRRHVDEFLAVAAVDDAVGAVPAQLREQLTELLGQVTHSPARLPERPRPLLGHLRSQVRHVRTISRPMQVMAAACIALVAIAFVLMSTLPFSRYSTDIGEQRTLELADTSVVTLNADSQIQWQINDTQREIELDRGEAIFKVSHDPSRPFRVHTRSGVVQAIGTQFNVYARPDGQTRVSVLEGKVRLTAQHRAGNPTAATMMLGAGEEADMRLDGTIRRNQQAIVENTVAWRERRLAFNDVLLEDMVLEFNRYNRSPRLRLEGVPVGVYRFAGIFNATDPQSLTELLAREPGLQVERDGDEIVIRAR